MATLKEKEIYKLVLSGVAIKNVSKEYGMTEDAIGNIILTNTPKVEDVSDQQVKLNRLWIQIELKIQEEQKTKKKDKSLDSLIWVYSTSLLTKQQ